MLNSQCVAEFLGTLIFLTIILKSKGDKYVVAGGLLAAILFMGDVSGGHFNPAVSFMKYSQNNIDATKLLCYVVSQLAGAYTATQIVKM
jgi:glycerol uptake facilitator-like aquaporin